MPSEGFKRAPPAPQVGLRVGSPGSGPSLCRAPRRPSSHQGLTWETGQRLAEHSDLKLGAAPSTSSDLVGLAEGGPAPPDSSEEEGALALCPEAPGPYGLCP